MENLPLRGTNSRLPFAVCRKRDAYVPRDQVSPLLSVYSLLLLHKNK